MNSVTVGKDSRGYWVNIQGEVKINGLSQEDATAIATRAAVATKDGGTQSKPVHPSTRPVMGWEYE